MSAKLDTLKELLQFYYSVIASTSSEVKMWFWINVSLQMATIVLGILATLMVALQNNENQKWMKPTGIIATTLITGVVSASTTFHVRENIDKLITLQSQIGTNLNELEFYIKEHPDEKTNLSVQKKYTDILNQLGEQRRRVLGSFGGADQSVPL